MGHSKQVTSLYVSEAEQLLYSGSMDGGLHVHRLEEHKLSWVKSYTLPHGINDIRLVGGRLRIAAGNCVYELARPFDDAFEQLEQAKGTISALNLDGGHELVVNVFAVAHLLTKEGKVHQVKLHSDGSLRVGERVIHQGHAGQVVSMAANQQGELFSLDSEGNLLTWQAEPHGGLAFRTRTSVKKGAWDESVLNHLDFDGGSGKVQASRAKEQDPKRACSARHGEAFVSSDGVAEWQGYRWKISMPATCIAAYNGDAAGEPGLLLVAIADESRRIRIYALPASGGASKDSTVKEWKPLKTIAFHAARITHLEWVPLGAGFAGPKVRGQGPLLLSSSLDNTTMGHLVRASDDEPVFSIREKALNVTSLQVLGATATAAAKDETKDNASSVQICLALEDASLKCFTIKSQN